MATMPLAFIFFAFFISDFSPKVPFICAGKDFIGPFKFMPEWFADICMESLSPFAHM
jgi:hypothetical protein